MGAAVVPEPICAVGATVRQRFITGRSSRVIASFLRSFFQGRRAALRSIPYARLPAVARNGAGVGPMRCGGPAGAIRSAMHRRAWKCITGHMSGAAPRMPAIWWCSAGGAIGCIMRLVSWAADLKPF